MRCAFPQVDVRLGRLIAAACVLLLVSGCGSTGSPPPAQSLPTQQVRATPGAPTPDLPVAKPAAPTPSPTAFDSTVPSATAAAQAFVLLSSAFGVGGNIPADYTCDGADRSPPLAWSGAPPGTSAFALVEQDNDVAVSANQPFTQWLLYNMPRTVTQLPAGVPARPLLSNGSQQGQNSHRTIGYVGPCPNQGDPPHHYSFELFAQDGYVTLETGASVDGVQSALAGHILAQTHLQAISQR
jgi:Raf kinase inhibitor-like YbhB/YbcL family protein